MSTDPFASEQERHEARGILLALDSHLAVVVSLASRPGFEWSADELATFPAPPGDTRPVQVRLSQWAAAHSSDLTEIHRLAASQASNDGELRRGLALAEQALASLFGHSVEDVHARLRTDAGAGLRTPIPAPGGLEEPISSPGSSEEPISLPGGPEEPSVTETVTLRPRPNEYFQRIKGQGESKTWMDRILGPSDSWWEKGGLVADGNGPALIDADGQRHPFPEAAKGGYLVESTVRLEPGAPAGTIPRRFLFVAAPPELGRRVLLVLPSQGFGGDVDGRVGLVRFARRAGLELVLRTYGSGLQDREFPGMNEAPNLEDAIHDQAAREASPMGRLHRVGQRLTRRFRGPRHRGSP